MESGNDGINGKSAKIITIGAGEITGGKYISFPKLSLKGKYYNLVNIYNYYNNIHIYIYIYICLYIYICIYQKQPQIVT